MLKPNPCKSRIAWFSLPTSPRLINNHDSGLATVCFDVKHDPPRTRSFQGAFMVFAIFLSDAFGQGYHPRRYTEYGAMWIQPGVKLYNLPHTEDDALVNRPHARTRFEIRKSAHPSSYISILVIHSQQRETKGGRP